ncbi:MAG: DNA translocase FtsK [Acidobacteriia bacterium]|nr:DNA translocase FtsK [Terriglobia bacterium]
MRAAIRRCLALQAGAHAFFSVLFRPSHPAESGRMVELSISDIRQALWRSYSRNEGTGCGATAEVGRIFHEVFAALMGSDPELQWQSALDAETIGDQDRLLDHIYDRLLGPRLTSRQAALAESGEQVWLLWSAVREMAAWLSGLLRQCAAGGLLRFDTETQNWIGAERLCAVEQAVDWEVRSPDWSAAVRISGVVDAVWQNPETGRWCALEYKLGESAPPLDLAQACLYHDMLSASGMKSDGAIAVVSFHPGRKERFFSGPELEAARRPLLDLIGKLAGVTADAVVPARQAPNAVTEEARTMGERLIATLGHYNVAARLVGDAVIGPAFLRYAILPARGVKVADIKRRSEELQVHLNLEQAPLIHNTGGTLVIDVKRAQPEIVLFSSILSQLPRPHARRGSARVPLGVDLEGHLHSIDMSQSPHVLVAGTAGSGKSEWMRAAIAGLLVTNTVDMLQLVAIDPKSSAFEDLEGSPFLWKNLGVIHPTEHSVPDLLDSLIAEMERRNRLFRDTGCDDLPAYIESSGNLLPRIVCFCDEYFDLVADKAARRQIEPGIARLGARARSAGIHLVLATQYPKADVVTGVIKANLSARVCLRVTDATQSRVILGQAGAEKLLGKGDLFFLDIGDPIRLQAPFLPKADRERIFRTGR